MIFFKPHSLLFFVMWSLSFVGLYLIANKASKVDSYVIHDICLGNLIATVLLMIAFFNDAVLVCFILLFLCMGLSSITMNEIFLSPKMMETSRYLNILSFYIIFLTYLLTLLTTTYGKLKY